MVTALLLGVRGAGPRPDGHGQPNTTYNDQIHHPQQLLFQQVGPEINLSNPRVSLWSLSYSLESEVLDLAQMVMAIRKQHKMTSFIIPNSFCFNKLAQNSIPGNPGAPHGHCPTPGSLRLWTSPRWSKTFSDHGFDLWGLRRIQQYPM